MGTVHDVAKLGFASGTNELYDKSRPSYPKSALSHIHQAIPSDLTAPYTIIEIGAGTGIFTRALLGHSEWSSSVKQITAVEPSAGMREQFVKSVQDKRVSIIDGAFEATNLEDASADIIAIAQAFHWCTDYERAATEFARVLKPGGIVALVWNTDDRATSWVDQVRDIMLQNVHDHPLFVSDRWRQVFDTPQYKEFFEPANESTFSHIVPATSQLVIDRHASKSHLVILPDDERSKVLDDIRNIVERAEGMVWIDKANGVFEYPYKTLVVICKKK